MVDSKSVDPRWSDPWPTMQLAWRDPPWRLSGRVLTAWFDAPWGLMEMAVSPALRPPAEPAIRARLRFYDLEFEALGFNPAQALAPLRGPSARQRSAFQHKWRGYQGDSIDFHVGGIS